jgi:hypothetical protein
MADRTSLGLLGFIFGGVTAAVVFMATVVVVNHVEGRFVLDAPPTTIVTTQR